MKFLVPPQIETYHGKTVDGRNPAPPRMMIYPIIDQVLTVPGGCLGFLPSTVSR